MFVYIGKVNVGFSSCKIIVRMPQESVTNESSSMLINTKKCIFFIRIIFTYI